MTKPSDGGAAFRCPTCGRFVSDGKTEYWDVEPGGERGFDPASPYCSERCAETMYARAARDTAPTETGE